MSHGSGGVDATTWDWVVVHQAIGMAMEYLGCSGRAAFETLITLAGGGVRPSRTYPAMSSNADSD